MNKRKYRKIVLNLITITILLTILYLVFRKDYKAILNCVSKISLLNLLLLLGMGICYQLLDAAVCFTLVHERLPSFQFKQAVEVIYLGVFGNIATSTAGTIPLQSYYLYQQGMQVGSGMGIMILQYVFHKTTIFLYAAFMILLQGQWLKSVIPELVKFIYPGLIVCALIIVFLVLLCTWTPIQQLLLWIIDRFPDTGKWINRKDTWRSNLKILYTESKEMLRNRTCCRNAMILNLLKLFWLFLIPFLCMKTLNITGITWGRTQTVSAIMLLLIGVLPNVSGAGPAEFSFLLLYTPFIGRVSAFSALILYRVATYFFPFLLSIVVFLKVKKTKENLREQNAGKFGGMK